MPGVVTKVGESRREAEDKWAERETPIDLRGATGRLKLARGGRPKRHDLDAPFPAIGTVEDVSDQLQSWFEDGGCDGFNFMPAINPLSLEEVIDKIVPEPRRRGICRTEYEGTTLRENLVVPATPPPLLN